MPSVGLADEWPLAPSRADCTKAQGGRFEAGLTVRVDGCLGGPEGVEFETHVLITETGPVRLDRFPFDGH